jgi:hypothetical protein
MGKNHAFPVSNNFLTFLFGFLQNGEFARLFFAPVKRKPEYCCLSVCAGKISAVLEILKWLARRG